MQSLDDLKDLDLSLGSCVTIGNFDGVHLGHQALVKQAAQIAKNDNLALILITFWPHPRMILPDSGGHRPLTTRQDKMRLLNQLDITNILELPFNKELAALSPAEFIHDYLLRLNLRQLVVGYDFTLGRKREGNIEVLRKLAKDMDFKVDKIQPLLLRGEAVSSTRLRKCIAAGDVKQAAALLGRPHSVRGKIIHGDARGAKLGYPTANLADFETLLPANGVYATRAIIEGKKYKALTNIGHNPTFAGNNLRVETHLLDYNQDIYGAEIEIELLERLREERKFQNGGELATQINLDVARAREILSSS